MPSTQLTQYIMCFQYTSHTYDLKRYMETFCDFLVFVTIAMKCTCTQRVIVIVLCVCLSVCLFVYYCRLGNFHVQNSYILIFMDSK